MNTPESKRISRTRRHARVRSRIVGSATRPRLAIYKSNKYLHAQIIDDAKGVTIVSGSTQALTKGTNPVNPGKPGHGARKMDGAKLLGADLAKKALDAGIKEVVFDRGGFRYTGRVSELAKAARQAGLKF